MMADAVLEARGGSYSYDGATPVLTDVTFAMETGSVLAILGANGAGKSTILDCLSGLTPHPVDWVFVDGKPLAAYSQRELSRTIAYVSQMQQPSFDYAVRDYLALGCSSSLGVFERPSKESFEAVERVLSDLSIEQLADKTLAKMSGGERQQVQIARALVQNPRILMLDEPTNPLDFGNQIKILKVIDDLAKKRNIAIIMTTHMPDHAILLGGDVGILGADGRMRCGPLETTLDEATLREIYHADLRLVHVDEVGREACLANSF